MKISRRVIKIQILPQDHQKKGQKLKKSPIKNKDKNGPQQNTISEINEEDEVPPQDKVDKLITDMFNTTFSKEINEDLDV